ncbi:MAG TPA: SusD/RagB family nutrient-binding outer membrane lipoprotein [Candidatus Phocaeicola gallinarum]|uniref:SusD/RagB family nutrient-binding outer membrane lipoprotein n=1 Tax=Bacteroidaceae TaxID=815 RepID=UPI001C5C6137|nr:SusD/RagB family nutrient-binding outer membrane lipoprotein [Bacteroides caecicola]MCL1625610.1 SusD/RagB family nutrient-binding outer membrane lipoprotein [Bacteroides caecicola]HJC95157.1 SusD/RagB family nutrient-binding outer membrane lipoprotein [Candidatus Phocaeicola gallinarum]
MKKYIILLLTLCSMSACDYETVNTDPYGVSDEELGPLKYGARFMNMQQRVIPIGSPSLTTGPGNDLQNTDLISSGNYIGYFGNNNNWGFNNESNWNFTDSRMNYAYQNFYSSIFLPWNEIYEIAKDAESPSEQAILEMANIVRNVAWLRATDVFGPIAYTSAGDGSIAPKFDSQEVVYKTMMADLAKSVELLNTISYRVMSQYDLIYDGNVQNWVKLANSLMLRMAVRVHFKDEALAREYIAKALDPKNGGVIEDIASEAKIQTSAKMPLLNSMMASVNDYNETRMGATIWGYLRGYRDPRLSKYFTQGTYGYGSYMQKDYFAVAPENTNSKQETTWSEKFASRPNIDANSPLYWFRASETYFLKAEAALYNLMEGDPQTFYEQGVSMSFQENGVNGFTADYLETTDKPLGIRTMAYWYGDYGHDLSIGNTSPKWDDYTGSLPQKDEQLQKIITQKYLALYPNAVEAWTEYRRTGFPYIMKPMDGAAAGRIGASAEDTRAPERFRFAPTAYNSNPNMAEIPKLLGGDDIGATKMWWVRSDRPKQPNQ